MTDDGGGTTDRDPTDLKWIGPATADVFADAEFSAGDVDDKRVSYRMLVDAGVNSGVAAKIRREHSLSWSFEAGEGLASRSVQVRGLGTDEAAWVAASSGDWEAEADARGAGNDATDTIGGSDGSSDAESDENQDGGSDGSPDDGSDGASADEAHDADDEAAWVAASANASVDPAETDGSGDPSAAEAAWRARSEPTPTTDLDAVDGAAAELLADAGITSVRSLGTADPEHVADVLDVDPDRVRRWYEAALDAEE